MVKKMMTNVFAVFVIFIVLAIIIPLPTPILDFLLIINIGLSLVILLMTMYIKKALEFSIFPTVLLLTTVFRLSLNVSTTRGILSKGYAGEVVKTFGEFVMGGDAIVGFIIFVIIVIVNFLVITKGSVQEGFSVTAGKTITVSGMVTGATLTAQGDITVKNGVFASTIQSQYGNINIAFGENDTITTRGNLTSTSLVGCRIKIEGDLDCTKNPGALVGGDCSVMGKFAVAQLGNKSYTPTIISVGSTTNLLLEMDSLEKQCTAIDEYIEKINTSIEFLQEKKRNGEHLDAEKEAYISSAIRLKVQKGMDKKPLKTRIEEIQKIINAKETLSVQVTKCVYPNVRINLNSFTTTTSAEYGKCNIVCGPNDIEFR